MFAIIKHGGKQYKDKAGDLVELEKMEQEIGATVTLGEVLAIGEEGGELKVGTPLLDGAAVEVKIVDQFRGKKVWAFKMKRRKSYRRTIGHRQSLTRVEVLNIKG